VTGRSERGEAISNTWNYPKAVGRDQVVAVNRRRQYALLLHRLEVVEQVLHLGGGPPGHLHHAGSVVAALIAVATASGSA
jgi:hypothetical protein